MERLGLAVAFSAVLHAGLLLGASRFPQGWGEGIAPSGQFARAPLQVRIEREHPGSATAVSPLERPYSPSVSTASRDATAARLSPAPSGRAAAQGTAFIPPAKYYRTAELDVKPQIKTRVMPDYPEAANLENTSGEVVVYVFISETGNVDDVTVTRAQPAGIFEEAAAAAFRAARFTPGMRDRKAVKSLVVLEVAFETAVQSDPVSAP